MKKTCKQCGKEFELGQQHGNEQVFCSTACKSKWQYENNVEERMCVICGKSFTIYKHKHTRTCSTECGAQLREKFSLQKMTCEYCGREYEGHYKNRNLFCCRKCKELWTVQQRHKNPEFAAAEKAKAKERRQCEPLCPQKCPQCGEMFVPKTKRAVYCSRKCKGKALQASKKIPCEIVKCAECGTEFLPNRRGTKFCSIQCQKKNAHRREYEKHKTAKENSGKVGQTDNQDKSITVG